MTKKQRHWQDLDSSHYLHPFTDHGQLSKKGSRVFTKGKGIYIWDTEGHQILDSMSGLWCVNLGYGRTELIEAAHQQMQELPYYNSFFQCAHPPAIELGEILSEIAPDGFSRVFYTGSGSEANDTVIRLVRRFWQLQDKPDKQIIIARKNAYHGSTIAAASLGGMEGMHTQGAGIPIPNIIHIAQPYWFQEGRDIDPNTFGIAVAEELEKAIDHHGIDKIAAFIAEPIQGAGGVIIPPETYWPAIQRICDDNEILLVADEVITGFGRLGEWFGSTTYEIKPDLIAFAKGVTSGYLPLGGVLVNDKVADTIIAKGGEFTHGFTYSGHPVSCAVAIANIKILAEDKVIDQVKNHTAPYLGQQWQSLIDHPIVGEARVKGLVAALELCKGEKVGRRFSAEQNAGSLCRDLAIENGLVMRAVGDTMIIAPPLIITHEQIDELITKAISTLDATAAAVKTT